jgi:hypothetical protein
MSVINYYCYCYFYYYYETKTVDMSWTGYFIELKNYYKIFIRRPEGKK